MALGIQRWEDKCHCPQEVQNIGMGGGGKICKLIGETSALELIFLFLVTYTHVYMCMYTYSNGTRLRIYSKGRSSTVGELEKTLAYQI